MIKTKKIVSIFCLTLMLLLISAGFASATVTRYIDCENASIDSGTYYLTDNGYSFKWQGYGSGQKPWLTNTTVFKDTYSLGMKCITSNYDKDRCEYYVQNISNGTTKYYGFATRINSDFPTPSNWYVFNQCWQSAPESPPIAMELESNTGKLQVKVRYGTDVNDAVRETLYTSSNALSKSVWHKFVVRFKVGTSGLLQVWWNGNQIVNYSGRVGYTGVTKQDVDIKLGVYRGQQNLNQSQFFDQIRVGDSYSEVDPDQ